MTKTEMIEAIRKACIRANPEIVELKFGCKVRCLNSELKQQYSLYGAGFVFGDRTIFDQIGPAIAPIIEHSPSLETGFIFHNEKDFEIIGRDIGLADIMRTIEPYIGNYKKKTSGWLNLLSMWDFANPLHLQSEETIRFIFNLLKNEKA